jgi:hypothetical protein
MYFDDFRCMRDEQTRKIFNQKNQKIYLKNLRKSASSAVKKSTSARHNHQSSAAAGGATPHCEL